MVDRLEAAGAVIVAKASLFEFAYAAFHPEFAATRNPWDLDRSCSGSSSGSAASLAGGLCYGSLGTDTGGSIRVPASLCGVVGLRPTYGLVSRRGVVPLSYSLDTVGPMARTVHDTALLLQAIAGPDAGDRTTATRPVPDYAARLGEGVRGLRVGIPRLQESENIDRDVLSAYKAACVLLEREGARLVDVALPDYTRARVVWRTICAVDAAEYHRPYLRTRAHDYHPVDRALLEMAEFIPATDYVHAERLRRRMIDEMRPTLQETDLLALPAFPCAAYPLDAADVEINGRRQPLADVTRSAPLFSLTGYPALVVPCGFTAEGLPTGMQLVGRPFSETELFRAAHAYEQAAGWHCRHPAI